MAKIEDEIKQAKFQDDKHRFMVNLMFTASWVNNKFTEELKPFGISPQQFNILRILRGGGDWMAMSDVKSRMVEKSPNATRLADKMIEKKLIERNRSETDRRVVHVRCTKKGLKMLDDIDKKGGSIRDAMKNKLTEKDARIASDIIEKLRE